MTSKEIAELNEQRFQTAFTVWELSHYTDKKSYQKMFSSMLFASKNMIKKEAEKKGIYIDVEGKAIDLTSLIFERDIVTHHKRPQKLSSYLYLPMLGIVYGHQLQFEEKCSSYESAVSKTERNIVFTEELSEEEVIPELKTNPIYIKNSKIYTTEEIQDPDFIFKAEGWFD